MLFALSPFPVRSLLLYLVVPSVSHGKPNFLCFYHFEFWRKVSHTTNPLMELLFHEQISGVFVPFFDEIDFAKIALSCDFALDLLCYKEGVHDSA